MPNCTRYVIVWNMVCKFLLFSLDECVAYKECSFLRLFSFWSRCHWSRPSSSVLHGIFQYLSWNPGRRIAVHVAHGLESARGIQVHGVWFR